MKKFILLMLLLHVPLVSQALEVFACEPEWGSLVAELAGELAKVTVATTALQDPHRLQARPSLIAATRRADLVVCTGADLEVGWLPLLLQRAGNPSIQPGRPGYFMAADYVRKLETPTVVDRSQGDVHPQGNPHIQLNPNNILRVAAKLAEQLGEVDRVNTDEYLRRLEDFGNRWQEAQMIWEKRADNLRGLRLVSHHRSFSYLADWLGLDIVATLEVKPGIPPSAAHLASLLEQLSDNAPAGVIRTPYENEKPSLWLARRLDISPLILFSAVDEKRGPANLFALFDQILDQLEAVAP